MANKKINKHLLLIVLLTLGLVGFANSDSEDSNPVLKYSIANGFIANIHKSLYKCTNLFFAISGHAQTTSSKTFLDTTADDYQVMASWFTAQAVLLESKIDSLKGEAPDIEEQLQYLSAYRNFIEEEVAKGNILPINTEAIWCSNISSFAQELFPLED